MDEKQDYAAYNDQEYEVEGFNDQEYDEQEYDDESYDDLPSSGGGNAEEDFADPDGGGKKKGPGPLMIAAGVVVALLVGLGGLYVVSPETLEAMNPMTMLVGSGDPGSELPPDGDVAPAPDEPKPKPTKAKPAAKKPVAKPATKTKPGDWSKPVKITNVPVVPKPPAKKPAAKKPVKVAVVEPATEAPPPKPVAKKAPVKVAVIKPKVMAAKPKPKVAAVGVAVPHPMKVDRQAAIAFAPGSFFVASTEMEKLWQFSTGLRGGGGSLHIEAVPGQEYDAVGISMKRANRVAELLRRNGNGNIKVDVKVGKARGMGRVVNVTYTRKL